MQELHDEKIPRQSESAPHLACPTSASALPLPPKSSSRFYLQPGASQLNVPKANTQYPSPNASPDTSCPPSPPHTLLQKQIATSGTQDNQNTQHTQANNTKEKIPSPKSSPALPTQSIDASSSESTNQLLPPPYRSVSGTKRKSAPIRSIKRPEQESECDEMGIVKLDVFSTFFKDPKRLLLSYCPFPLSVSRKVNSTSSTKATASSSPPKSESHVMSSSAKQLSASSPKISTRSTSTTSSSLQKQQQQVLSSSAPTTRSSSSLQQEQGARSSVSTRQTPSQPIAIPRRNSTSAIANNTLAVSAATAMATFRSSTTTSSSVTSSSRRSVNVDIMNSDDEEEDESEDEAVEIDDMEEEKASSEEENKGSEEADNENQPEDEDEDQEMEDESDSADDAESDYDEPEMCNFKRRGSVVENLSRRGSIAESNGTASSKKKRARSATPTSEAPHSVHKSTSGKNSKNTDNSSMASSPSADDGEYVPTKSHYKNLKRASSTISSSSNRSSASPCKKSSSSSSSKSQSSSAPKTRAAPTKANKPLPDFLGGGRIIKDHNGVMITVDMDIFAKCDDNATPMVWKGQPLDIPEDSPRRSELAPNEIITCETLRILPAQYLEIKETLLATVVVRGPYKKRDAQGWFRIDVNKTNKLYDWFVGNKWIEIATQEWQKRVKSGLV